MRALRSAASGILTAISLILTLPSAAFATDDSETFFAGPILNASLAVPDVEVEKIGAEHRPYVRARLQIGDDTFTSVGIKLKGAAGSFRDFGDRPALTINLDKFQKNQKFAGLQKFHFNNSVQDDTFLNECLASQLFLEAGCKTPRATQIHLTLNDRDMKLYVFKESFDSRFLKRNFLQPKGNLYEGGFVQDLDGDLQKDEGTGVDDRSDVAAIVEACHIEVPKERWTKIAELVDIDEFLTFMAMERLTSHWDGYSENANNYRLYINPETGKAVFLAHGMDQTFGDPGMPLFNHSKAMISAAIMQNREWRDGYRTRVSELASLFEAGSLLARVDALAARVEPALAACSPDDIGPWKERVEGLRQRLRERAENIHQQLSEPEPQPQEFTDQIAVLADGWWPQGEVDEMKVDAVPLPDEDQAYFIGGGSNDRSMGSWRRHVLLAAGRYTLHAGCRVRGLQPIENEPSGVGIGISGRPRELQCPTEPTRLDLSTTFEVLEDQRQIELVAELRSKTGNVWFTPEDFVLRRVAESREGEK